MDKVRDISTSLISDDTIRQKLPSIFLDSILTDSQFYITIVSQNILDLLEFTQDELAGKRLDYLSCDSDLIAILKTQPQTGYFEERSVTLVTKSQRKIVFGISGFYLGLISDMNGPVIFTLRSRDQAEALKLQLQAKKAELDNFIYRAAHDLRGPLATIKGLVNLLKMRGGNPETDHLIHLIDTHANKLDERLFQLVYLTHEDVDVPSPGEFYYPNSIETALRKIIEKNAFVDFLEFHFSAPDGKLKDIDCGVLYAMLENLLLYIISLPMTGIHNQIFYRIENYGKDLHITIGAMGFVISDQLVNALKLPNFSYTDLVKYPQMINFYTARKRADQLHAIVKVNVLCSEKQRIEIFIPSSHNQTT